jgi:hypothetical protein
LGDQQYGQRTHASGFEAADEITDAPAQAGGERQQDSAQ